MVPFMLSVCFVPALFYNSPRLLPVGSVGARRDVVSSSTVGLEANDSVIESSRYWSVSVTSEYDCGDPAPTQPPSPSAGTLLMWRLGGAGSGNVYRPDPLTSDP